ncbi:MAG: hypothetical protein OCD01_05540 [Fibrobacterales bacterium]
MTKLFPHNPFEPKIQWAALFLKEIVLLVGTEMVNGKAIVVQSFKGDYEEASLLAQKLHLQHKGVSVVTNRIPVKITNIGSITEFTPDELSSEEERAEPIGIDKNQLHCTHLDDNGFRMLMQYREDHVAEFLSSLPAGFETVAAIYPTEIMSYLTIAPAVEYSSAALYIDSDRTHILYYTSGVLHHTLTLKIGESTAVEEPEKYRIELQKAFIYYWEARVLEEPLSEVILLTECEAVSYILETFNIPVKRLGNTDSDSYSELFQSLASEATNVSHLDISLGDQNREAIHSMHDWNNWSFNLLKIASLPVLLLLTLSLISGIWYGVNAFLYADAESTYEMELKKIEQVTEKQKEIAAEKGLVEGILLKNSGVMHDYGAIARAVPGELWINSWESEKETGSGYKHVVSGYTTQEVKVSLYLATLEKVKSFKSIRLVSTEFIEGKRVQKKTKLKANNKDLIHFVIEVLAE